MSILDMLLQTFLKKVLGCNLEALSLMGVMAVEAQRRNGF